nr:MAG TPA: hypothetical protein [Caudoviricetes sp.]
MSVTTNSPEVRAEQDAQAQRNKTFEAFACREIDEQTFASIKVFDDDAKFQYTRDYIVTELYRSFTGYMNYAQLPLPPELIIENFINEDKFNELVIPHLAKVGFRINQIQSVTNDQGVVYESTQVIGSPLQQAEVKIQTAEDLRIHVLTLLSLQARNTLPDTKNLLSVASAHIEVCGRYETFADLKAFVDGTLAQVEQDAIAKVKAEQAAAEAEAANQDNDELDAVEAPADEPLDADAEEEALDEIGPDDVDTPDDEKADVIDTPANEDHLKDPA